MNSFIERWAAGIEDGDLMEIVEQYTETASLLATVEDTPLFGRSQIFDYFLELMKRKDLACIFQEIEEVYPNVWIGLYSFEWDDGELPGRFTFVVSEDGIEHHHSSALPSTRGEANG